MWNRLGLAVLSGSLLACGGSARSTHDPDASAGRAAGGSPDSPGNEAGGGQDHTNSQGGISAQGGSAVHLGPGSWDVTGIVKTTPQQQSFCDHLDFSLNVDGGTMTLGEEGGVSWTAVQIVDGAYVARSFNLLTGGCNTDRLFVDELRLEGIDSDGDGEADRLEATVTLDQVKILALDTYAFATVTIQLTAVPDQSSPKLILPNDIDAWFPPTPFGVNASEPLDPTAKLTLTGTSTVPLPAIPASDPLVARPAAKFGTSEILPFGGTWQLDATGKDLAGHDLKVGPPIIFKTLPDPGVQAQDGFEGALSGVIGSAPSIVTGFGMIPALSGEHSLWIDPNHGVAFRLQRAGSQNHVHFVARSFFAKSGNTINASASVIGGTQLVAFTRPTAPDSTTSATGDEQLPWASDAVQLDAVLDDPGTDVVLSISGSGCPNVFQCPPPTAFMIDDLKID